MGPDVKSAGQGKEKIKLWVQEQLATIGVPSSAGQDMSEGTNEDTREGVPPGAGAGAWALEVHLQHPQDTLQLLS